MECEVVSMNAVPNPPEPKRESLPRQIYQRICDLDRNEEKALKIPTKGSKDLYRIRGLLRTMAKKDGLRLLTSRNDEYTALYAWLVVEKEEKRG